MKSIQLVILLIFSTFYLNAQELTQTVRGKILDADNALPIAYANIIILGSDPIIGTTSDENGDFILEAIPVGRYDIEVSYIGYANSIMKEVLVQAGKETMLEIQLREQAFTIDEEIIVRPDISKNKALNPMASISSRMLSVEEASRYAGGFDDPARLAATFAGVASNVSSNEIILRGNAPQYLQWKMEGVEIFNPNHFANLSTFGGGGLTALSSQLMANSDFLTGAMPAEYNNALSGVFDLKMRNGNTEKHEHSLQVGLIGLDLASEGPFSKKSNASYLFNYRYSTLSLMSALLPEDAAGTSYQDFAFKIYLPSLKRGVINIWGLGLFDKSGQKAELDPSEWKYQQDKEEQDVKQGMATVGINHHYFFNDAIKLVSSLNWSFSFMDLKTQQINEAIELEDFEKIRNYNHNWTFTNQLNIKFNKKHKNRTGWTLRNLNYDLGLAQRTTAALTLNPIVDEKGNSFLLTAFSSSAIDLSPKWKLITGLSLQHFALNNSTSFEPRLSSTWQLTSKWSTGIAYGLHSRLEPLNFYFVQNENGEAINKDLGFSKAHHVVGQINYAPSADWNIKMEPYYQYLFDIPMKEGSNFSFINLEGDWFINDPLLNKGKGRNYGLDITIERYLKKGIYGMLNTSIFSSKYKNQDTWLNTRHNANIIANFLIGKDFNVGSNKQNLLSLNIRLAYQGGQRYIPVDIDQSIAARDVIFQNETGYNAQFDPSFVSHFTAKYILNKKKTSQEFSLKILNANGYKEFVDFRYNFIENRVEAFREAVIIPNLSYKLSF